jgi:hypothetical protein
MQVSLGDYITGADGRVMNYKEFCTRIIDRWEPSGSSACWISINVRFEPRFVQIEDAARARTD